MVKFIIIKQSERVLEADLDKVSIKNIHILLKNNNKKTELKKIYSWDFDEDKVVCYGYKTGKEEDINKLELPYPIDNILYYNELVFFTLNDKDEYTSIIEEEFEEFYEMIFGGFEDIDSEDSGENYADEEYEDDGFVVID